MPIYEYYCHGCHKDLEIIQKFSDKPLKKCPECGGRLEKKLSLSAFQLKGSGWYKDLYSSAKPEKKSEGTTGGEKKSETKTETKTESKTTTKETKTP